MGVPLEITIRLKTVSAATILLIGLSVEAAAQQLIVSAASSLTNAFKEVGVEFQRAHPGKQVDLNLAASDVLLKQIISGAPVDVFASADQESMDRAVSEKAIDRSTRVNFAANRLVLAVPADSKVKIRSINDLMTPRITRIGVGQPSTVPAGRYAKRVLDGVKLWAALEMKLIYSQNVRQNLNYIARGEVDAGFVYATDAALMKDKVKIALAIATPEAILYPIAITARSPYPNLARLFLAFVISDDGQEILRKHGFGGRKP